jgi:hypothetical protein
MTKIARSRVFWVLTLLITSLSTRSTGSALPTTLQVGQALQAPSSLTVEGTETVTDVRSASQREGLRKFSDSMVDGLYAAKRFTRAQWVASKQQDAVIENIIPQQRLRFTLSLSGGRILAKIGSDGAAYVYDGSHSLQTKDTSGIDYVYPGYGALPVIPLPGINFTGLPIIKSAVIKSQGVNRTEVLGLSPVLPFDTAGSLTYLPSASTFIRSNGSPLRLQSCTTYNKFGIQESWDFVSYMQTGSYYISNAFNLLTYQSYRDSSGKAKNGKYIRYEFKIDGASITHLPDSSFTFSNWMHQRDQVVLVEPGVPNTIFAYDGGGGSLEDQQAAANLDQEVRSKLKTGRQSKGGGGSSSAGILVLASLSCLLIAWFVVKRRLSVPS